MYRLNYVVDGDVTKQTTVQLAKRQRRLKANATPSTRRKHISRLAKEVIGKIDSSFGDYAAEFGPLVVAKVALHYGLNVIQSSALSFSELVSIGLANKLSVNQLSNVISSFVSLRPDWRGKMFPSQVKKGMLNVIKSGNLKFETRFLELIISKQNDKIALRPYWCLLKPYELLELLVESSFAQSHFRRSIEFSNIQDAIVAVVGLDKSTVNTGCSMRVANRRNGNSSNHTQLLAAVHDAAECHPNFAETFFRPGSPLRSYLQSYVNDEIQMIVLQISTSSSDTICRCVSFIPTPILPPCTGRKINVNVAQDYYIDEDDQMDWYCESLSAQVPTTSNIITVRIVRSETAIFGIQLLDRSSSQTILSLQFREPIILPEDVLDDLSSTIKIICLQVFGFTSNDYKCGLTLSGIVSASAKHPCTACVESSNRFHLPSEALQKYRDPTKEVRKDAPLRTGEYSIIKCHEEILKWKGNGALHLTAAELKIIHDKNGSVFHVPLLIIPPQKDTGEPMHISEGLMDHLFKRLRKLAIAIDKRSDWRKSGEKFLEELDEILLRFEPPPAGESSEYSNLCKENRLLFKEAMRLAKVVDEGKECVRGFEELKMDAEDVDNVNVDLSDSNKLRLDKAIDDAHTAINEAIRKSEEALQKCVDHAHRTKYAHLNKLKRAAAKIRPLLIKNLNGNGIGPCQHALRSAIKAAGGKFLTQHGGNSLTNNNGMDVIERFSEIAQYMSNLFPPDTADGQLLRDQYKLFTNVAETMSPLLRFLKSQEKCDETQFMKVLEPFISAWDTAFPEQNYFLKLHHLVTHVYYFIKEYGMYGILSAESFEAIHVVIEQLLKMSASQTTEKKIATTNAKTQTLSKEAVRKATGAINEGRTGKPRGPYRKKVVSPGDNSASDYMQHKVVNFDDVQFIEVLQGTGLVKQTWEEWYSFLMHHRAPRSWMEPFHSSPTLSKKLKEEFIYIGD